MMILFWDLIEESPVFTDEDRLRVTNAFSKQLDHRKREGIYGRGVPRAIGSRHGQWAAVSHYCLGRYFQKDYPNPIWHHCVLGAINHFGSLHKYAWVGGESDNLFWYNTGHAPILTHLLLSGDREPVKNGVLRTLLLGQEILASGRANDWALRSAAIDFLHKAAYLMQDGRYIHYRNLSGVDTTVFRLGQSFWPEGHLAPKPPADLAGKWNIFQLSEPAWQARRNGFPLEHSFGFGSFRSTWDASGDYILLDGFNGASRNPYHSFAILQLRIDGRTLLEGYSNQLLTRADGLVEPKVAMNGALRHRDVIGPTVVAVGEVPDAAYCNWRRTLVQRTGQYALVADDLTFRTDSENIEVQIKWENASGLGRRLPAPGVMRLTTVGGAKVPPGWVHKKALASECTTNLTGPRGMVQLDSIGLALLRSESIGDWIEMPFRLGKRTSGEVYVGFVKYVDRGVARILLDGKPVGKPCDLYSSGAETDRVSLGRHDLAAGEHRLRVETVAMRAGSDKCYVGLMGVTVRPDGAPKAGTREAFDVCLSDPVENKAGGRITTMEWLGAVKKEEHRIFFTAIASNARDPKTHAACARVADNAAALALPQPALAVVGAYEGIEGELVVLAEDHLFGRGLRSAALGGLLIRADAPVDVDWDFTSGRLHVRAEKAATVTVAGASPLSIKPGRHEVKTVRPTSAGIRETRRLLAKMLSDARTARAAHAAATKARRVVKAPPLRTGFTADVGGRVVDLITIPDNGGRLICAAEGKSVHVLSAGGK